jgi:glycosyltransferase involved in cell wall biosynthesis
LCTDRIVTISPQQRAEINEVFRVGRREQFNVIPLGIDVGETSEASRSLREEIGAAPDEALVGIVGRLCAVKNHELLLNAAARLTDETARVRFVIIGDGHLRGALENETRRLGIIDKVSFAGLRNDVTALYKELDVVALTSLNEGTPVTLIEAMNSGRAVAATEVGGVVDILGNRSSAGGSFSVWDHGVTARSGDVEGFAEALRFLIANPDLRLKMGQRGHVFVRKHLSRERLLSDVEHLYCELATDAQVERGKVHPPFQVSKRSIGNRPV